MAEQLEMITVEELVENEIDPSLLDEVEQDENSVSSEPLLIGIEVDDEHQQACTNIKNTRIRSKKSNPSTWKTNVKKQKRMNGQEYVSVIKTVSEDRVESQNRVNPAKEIGEACQSTKCRKNRSCHKFTKSDRTSIFNEFWSKTWESKKMFVTSNVDLTEPIRRRKATSLTVQNRIIYYLKLEKRKVTVCKKFFMSTLGLKSTQLYNWIFPKQQQQQQRRGNNPINKRKEFLNNFFIRLPKVPSHYCRKDSTKSYLDHTVKSKTDLFESYKAKCLEAGIKGLSRTVFDYCFDEQNLGLFKPKSDQCDLCTMYENHQLSEADYENHIMKKDESRAEKGKDKADAIAGKCHTLTVDLQQVKLSPCILASKSYFKQKIASHNYTVYNLKNRHTKCFWFDETQAELNASSFASCIVNYLTENCLSPQSVPINIFSDGCPSQNRNWILSNALLHFSVHNNITITQKYLEKGHTQMEVDSVHSSIESKLTRQNIFLPSDYVQKSREARKTPFPYEAEQLQFDFFLNFADENVFKYKDIRPGQKPGDPVVVDIRVLQYRPEGKIFYKLEYSEEFRELPNINKTFSSFAGSFPRSYQERLKITEEKYKDLQDLKTVIPPEFHYYYDELLIGKISKKNIKK